jgi:hypothetical protein
MRLLVLASSLLLFALPGTTAEAKRHHCNPPGAKSVARDERGRVYYVSRNDFDYYYYACFYRTGRTRPVGDNPHDIDLEIEAVRLATPYVAFKQFYRSSQSQATDLSRLDMRTGRRVVVEPSGGTRRFIATSFGAVVWIRTADSGVEVKKVDSDGPATLDQGTNVPGRSLRLSRNGHRVYWRNGGIRKSARLR